MKGRGRIEATFARRRRKSLGFDSKSFLATVLICAPHRLLHLHLRITQVLLRRDMSVCQYEIFVCLAIKKTDRVSIIARCYIHYVVQGRVREKDEPVIPEKICNSALEIHAGIGCSTALERKSNKMYHQCLIDNPASAPLDSLRVPCS